MAWNLLDRGSRSAASQTRRRQSRRRGRRLRLESLETRALLAAFIVNTFGDSVDADLEDGVAEDAAGNTSLRAAVMEANAQGGAHTIELGAGTYSLTIDSGSPDGGDFERDLDILAGTVLTITGAGADQTTIDAGGLFRIFQVHSNASLSLQGVTLTGGNVTTMLDGGGLWGGAIASSGELTVSDSVIRDSVATNGGGAIHVSGTSGTALIERTEFIGNRAVGTNGSGGALHSRSGTITVTDSTFEKNSAGGNGGAIGSLSAAFVITNSTFSGNWVGQSADAPGGRGGAIFNNDGSLNLNHVTITENRAGEGGGLVSVGAAANVQNSLIAGNFANVTTSSDVDALLNSGGGNLIGIFDGSTGNSSDLTGTVGSPLDPLLDALADNGGPTRTHALLVDSPAIDAAVASTVSTDQRGVSRPQGSAADIGAFEFEPEDPVDPVENQAPEAVNDFFTMLGNGSLEIDAPGVLANDSDPDGDDLTAILVDQPSFGSLDFNADGSFVYTPNLGFAGDDLFTYQAFDGDLTSGVAIVTISVQPIVEAIEIDIVSDDGTNTIDLAVDGWVTVVIRGGELFDLSLIDIDSLRFGVSGTENSIERDGKGAKAAVVYEWADVDGVPELVVRFDTKRTKLSVGDTEATLTGSLLDGQSFAVSAAVEVISSGSGNGKGNAGGKSQGGGNAKGRGNR